MPPKIECSPTDSNLAHPNMWIKNYTLKGRANLNFQISVLAKETYFQQRLQYSSTKINM